MYAGFHNKYFHPQGDAEYSCGSCQKWLVLVHTSALFDVRWDLWMCCSTCDDKTADSQGVENMNRIESYHYSCHGKMWHVPSMWSVNDQNNTALKKDRIESNWETSKDMKWWSLPCVKINIYLRTTKRDSNRAEESWRTRQRGLWIMWFRTNDDRSSLDKA